MLERILEKLGVASIDELVDREKKFLEKFKGMEAERKNPFLVLSREELDFMINYTQKMNITF